MSEGLVAPINKVMLVATSPLGVYETEFSGLTVEADQYIYKYQKLLYSLCLVWN